MRVKKCFYCEIGCLSMVPKLTRLATRCCLVFMSGAAGSELRQGPQRAAALLVMKVINVESLKLLVNLPVCGQACETTAEQTHSRILLGDLEK
jgi:hypothetical protein